MKGLTAVLLFVLTFTCLPGQNFPALSWMDSNLERVYRISVDSTWDVWSGSEWVVKRKLLFEELQWADFRGVGKLTYVPGNDRPVFVADGTSQVYVLDTIRGIFLRLDRSLDRGIQYGAIRFFRGNRLYAVGGYGYGISHAQVAYFDLDRPGWKIEATTGGPLSTYGAVWQYDEEEDALYTTWTKVITPELEEDRDPRIWRFGFGQSEWTNPGFLTDSVRAILTGKEGIPWPIGWFLPGDQPALIDLQKNEIHWLDPTMSNGKMAQVGDGAFEGKGQGAAKHAWINIQQKTGEFGLESVHQRVTWTRILESRLKTRQAWQAKESTSSYWLLVSLLITLALVVVYVLRKSFLKPFRKGATVDAEENFFNSLDRREVTLLRALMRYGMRGEGLKSDKISSIMGWNDKSWDNQRKWRNNLIKELNISAEEHLHIKELITREQALEDKRERVYRLTGDGFRLLRDSIHFISDGTKPV